MGRDSQFKVILFDLGGVLLRLNDPIETFGLKMDRTEFKDRWLRSATVRSFEAGGLSTDEFAKRIVAEAELPYGWQEFIRRFDSWPDRLFDDTIDVLDSIPATFSRALLSNINALHWGRDSISAPLAGHMDRLFLSFETGFVKPDREAFEQVTESYECRADEVLFFDDSPSSIKSAGDLGMRAVLVEGIDAVRRNLLEHRVLD